VTPSGIEDAVFRLVKQCLNELRYRVTLLLKYHCMKTYGKEETESHSVLAPAQMAVCGEIHTTCNFHSGIYPCCPLNRRLVGPQNDLGAFRAISAFILCLRLLVYYERKAGFRLSGI